VFPNRTRARAKLAYREVARSRAGALVNSSEDALSACRSSTRKPAVKAPPAVDAVVQDAV
jgi:hypothetical protein